MGNTAVASGMYVQKSPRGHSALREILRGISAATPRTRGGAREQHLPRSRPYPSHVQEQYRSGESPHRKREKRHLHPILVERGCDGW